MGNALDFNMTLTSTCFLLGIFPCVSGMALSYDACRTFTTPSRNTMNIQECTEAIRAKVGDNSGLNAVLKFDCGDDGQILIDGVSAPNTVDNNDRDADCTVAITLENLNNLLTGKLDPVTGFMGGKFKVSGDMSVAMKLQRVV